MVRTRRREGRVDWGLHQIITDLPDEFFPAIDELVREGSPSFKLFMAYPGARMVEDDVIFKAMRRSAENGAFVLMHCENGRVIQLLEEEAIAAGHVDPPFNAVTRPPVTESEATARAVSLAELAGVPVYVVHLTWRWRWRRWSQRRSEDYLHTRRPVRSICFSPRTS